MPIFRNQGSRTRPTYKDIRLLRDVSVRIQVYHSIRHLKLRSFSLSIYSRIVQYCGTSINCQTKLVAITNSWVYRIWTQSITEQQMPYPSTLQFRRDPFCSIPILSDFHLHSYPRHRQPFTSKHWYHVLYHEYWSL